MYSNDKATLTLYKESLKRTCLDYVIHFHDIQTQINRIIPMAFDLVQQLVESFQREDKTISARLVALVCYTREETNEKINVYHPSFKSEVIADAEHFFINHMLKIAERMECYNRQGSNLAIQGICEIHLHITRLTTTLSKS